MEVHELVTIMKCVSFLRRKLLKHRFCTPCNDLQTSIFFFVTIFFLSHKELSTVSGTHRYMGKAMKPRFALKRLQKLGKSRHYNNSKSSSLEIASPGTYIQVQSSPQPKSKKWSRLYTWNSENWKGCLLPLDLAWQEDSQSQNYRKFKVREFKLQYQYEL